ncbi:EAL domain-containing protein [Desulfosarcina sp.]|uniref:EAL domain-containing protein n=1 Tax=Desulfosarcina sp. TaxID=2027861 RepID=UPI003563941B
MQWCLEAVADAGRKWLVCIESVPFVIGRADDCDLKLIDDRISRHHCEIRISSDLLWIRDLESTNGTHVNEKRIKHAELLEPDDIISIEKYEFKVKRFSVSTAAASDETIHSTITKDISDLSFFEPKLQKLIQRRKVVPHFQPVARFSDLTEVGYEILGRVDDEELPSNPSELLDMAACLGLASDLSSLFREVGVEMGKNLPGSPLLFVNTTQLEIYEIDALLASLRRIREIAPFSKIVLEINEKAAADTNQFPRLRDALGKMDMRLAFDDFGVGQTRLVDLSTISPDYLKFDISLIRQVHLAPKRLHQMISTFIKASHDLGILTLAEGIECAEEAEVCNQLGFDLGQGFFFGRPAPITANEINLNSTQGA